MAVIWAMRSDNASFNARYSPSGLTPGVVFSTAGGASPVYEVDAAAIGGNRFNLGTTAAASRSLTYNGAGIFNAKTISVLIRARVLASGLLGMFDILGEPSLMPNRFGLYQNSSVWKSVINDKNGVAVSSSPSLATQAPDTANYADFVLTWDGTTAANKIMFWYNGTNLGNSTAAISWANPQDATIVKMINIGSVNGGVASVYMYVNEVVIWNTVITPTSVALVSGTGSLNGSTRNSFVDVVAFDGTSSIDPGVANVRNATAYTISGTAFTGTLTSPSLANTKIGVAGDGGTGTYDGSDRWTAPSVGDLRSGIQLKNNSTSLNLTGTLTVPSLANTKIGVSGDGGAGTYDGSDRWTAPAVTDLRSGIQLKNNSTSLNLTGTLTVASLANTKIGIAGDGGNGTYTGSDRWSDPGIANVVSGISYKANSTTNNMTGTYVGGGGSTPSGSWGLVPLGSNGLS